MGPVSKHEIDLLFTHMYTHSLKIILYSVVLCVCPLITTCHIRFRSNFPLVASCQCSKNFRFWSILSFGIRGAQHVYN